MNIKKSTDMFLKYCERRKLSKNTLTLYRNSLGYFLRWLTENGIDVEHTDITDLQKYVLKEYMLHLQCEYAISSVKTMYCILSSFYTWLVDECEVMDTNLIRTIKIKFKHEDIKPNVVTSEDMKKFKAYFDSIPPINRKFYYTRDRLMIEMLYSCGLRISELVNLKYSDYNPDDNSFTLIAKGNKSHKIYLTNKNTLKLFEANRRNKCGKHDLVFSTARGNKLAICYCNDTIRKYAALAGINKHLTAHCFRRGCATNLVENGVDVSKVKEVLGHANIGTTMRYVRLSNKTVENVMRYHNPLDNI